MTKKQELLNYCELNLDNITNILELETIINSSSTCFMTINASKSRTINIIIDNFDDELLGSMPNDFTIHHIQSWKVVSI